MLTWKNASKGDLKRLSVIQTILKKRPDLVERLFHPLEPCLRISPESVLRGLSSNERFLVKLAIDVWRDSDETSLYAINLLDAENFENVIAALRSIRSA